ncbi:MAG: YggS family pyridoxal phosphate-dependent enzyme [Corynebacteriales bacterium]|nr:YggS family pyridoxal phosphate-dependent enzyme [Mycobacteriales bacterium]
MAERLGQVRERIETACQRVGRDSAEITLIGITKTYPASDAELLLELGLRDLGENRDQEAKVKAAAVPNARWHFVGQLQRNKANSVAAYADVVHSVDRPELIVALERAAARYQRTLDILVQVSLDERPDTGVLGPRGGVIPTQVQALARQMEPCRWLRLRGLMAVAPRDSPAMPAFSQLSALSKKLRVEYPMANWLSAGMSGDMEDAISCGATHLRIGGALLGKRAQG